MSLVYLTKPKTTLLTTRARVLLELGLDPASVNATRDAFLDSLIAEASDALARAALRPFARGEVQEQKQGTDSTSMLLTLTPIVDLEAVTWRTEAIENSDDDSIPEYVIEDASAGLLFRFQTWVQTGLLPVGISRDPLPGRARSDWGFTYWGGYLMPGDNLTASGYVVSASGRTITRRVGAAAWPLLVAGDTAVLALPLNVGPVTVLERTDDVITCLDALTDDVGTSASSVVVQTLPPVAVGLAAGVVKAWYLQTFRGDPRVTSESIGDYSYTLTPGTRQIPDALLAEWLAQFGRYDTGDL